MQMVWCDALYKVYREVIWAAGGRSFLQAKELESQ